MKRITLTILLLAPPAALHAADATSPLKVFILAGQSNMEGQAVVDLEGDDYNQGRGTLVRLMLDPAKAPLFKHLRDGQGKWVVRDDVWVRYRREHGPLLCGPLAIGFSVYGDKHHFGPELQFGHVIGDFFDDQVLLIKTAWGGKSLHKDFRPPSSGGRVGPYYTEMLAEIREAVANLKADFPGYAGSGFEFAGFVWYHGWNDGCEPETAVPQYETNLVNLIKDVRRDLHQPNLPVVIGELTGPWVQAPGEWATLRKAQAAAAARPEFKGNVVFVETHDFVRKPEDSPNPSHGHHEFGNAETYFLVGDALGKAMKALQARTETFDRDPGWPGVNNRSARQREPATVRQDFGYSRTNHAGGKPGEIGGTITPAGEAAWYGKVIGRKTLDDPLRASGTLACPDGAFHILLGFFNSSTTNEWRTPNSMVLRLNGRGDHFFAYVEYCTARWRAGGDTTPFPSREDPATGRMGLMGFPSGGKAHRWGIAYDPQGNGGKGVVTATIDDATAACELGEGHKSDGAAFDRFGILNVVKSADSAGEIYFDDISIGDGVESFDEDPRWEGLNNRGTYRSTIVRPWFDFGCSPTSFAGGRSAGELGGTIFRGDCRYPERMASIGDSVGPLTLDKPFRASGKVAMRRGVSDSTTLFGFFSSEDSMRRNDSQSDAIPESVAGIHIEGPSSEGFFFYPVCRARGDGGQHGDVRSSPRILPDGASHDWRLEYDPDGAGGRGRITVVLDDRRTVLDLEDGVRAKGTRLDRFGIVTSWIDGNRQDVYWDDLEYTVRQ